MLHRDAKNTIYLKKASSARADRATAQLDDGRTTTGFGDFS